MSANPTCRICINEKNQIIGEHVELATGYFSRLRGLLGRKGLDEGAGLLLSPCSAIHCFGMKFIIDAVFLDLEYRVVAIFPDMKPAAIASHHQARHVLELRAGAARQHNIQIGDQLVIVSD
jgi:Uncharacterized conserved protein